MGWEIGQDESGDDDAGVFVIRAGDINGDSYIAFNHSELNLNEGVAEGAGDIYSIRQMGDIANDLGNGYVLADESYDDDDGFTKAMYAVYHQEGEDQFRFVDWVNTRSSYRYTQDEFNQAVQQIVDNDSRNNKVSNITESLDYLEEK